MFGFLNFFLSLLLSFLWKTQALNYLQGLRAFSFVTFTARMPIFSGSLMILTCLSSSLSLSPPHTLKRLCHFLKRNMTHSFCHAAAVLACHICYLAVISHMSILLNVCINRCYACFFAPMPCATLMESAIHIRERNWLTDTNQHCCLIFSLSV